MPFDPESGAYVSGGDRPWSMPTTSSGDVISAFNTYAAYRRNREAQVLDTMLKLQKAGEEGYDVSQTPEGGDALNALGVSPETETGLYQNSPGAQFKSQINALPEDQFNEENISKIGLKTGATSAKDYFSNESRAIGNSARATQAKAAQDRAFNTAARDTWKSAYENNDTKDAAAAQFRAQMKFNYPELTDERLDALTGQLEGAFGGKTKAEVSKLNAQTATETAKEWMIRQKTPVQISLMNAKSELDKEMAALASARADVEREKADGTLPATQKDYLALADHADAIAANTRKILPIGPGAAAEQNKALAELEKRAKDLRAAASTTATASAEAVDSRKKKGKPGGEVKAQVLGPSTAAEGTVKYTKDGRKVITRNKSWVLAD